MQICLHDACIGQAAGCSLKGMSRLLSLAGLTLLGTAVSNAAAGNLLELRGKIVDEARRVRPFRITLFSVETTYSTSTLTDPGGEFRFRKLDPGNYTLSILRRGLGEVHRTIVVTSGLADKKGVVRVLLPFSPAEAAESGSSALVSRNQLAIPGKARNQYLEAARRMAKRDTEGARRSFEEAVRIAPKYSAAWNALGVIAYQQAHFEDAEDKFRKAAEAEPGAYDPQVNLGGVLLNLNRAEDALQYNQRAAQMRPKDALANAQLGMSYFALGNIGRAEEFLKEAERLDPAHFTQPQWFLAAIYAERGDRSAAIQELRALIEHHPDGSAAERARRAVAQLQQNRPTGTAPVVPGDVPSGRR
jgi:tetratricopeptide (TPR) repeat protein